MPNVKDLRFGDFMPLDRKTGKPIKDGKPGSLHFHMDLGSCYDSFIEEQMNSFVPKHKSFLKPRDLVYVKKPTKAQEDAAIEKEKEKTEADLVYDQVTRD